MRKKIAFIGAFEGPCTLPKATVCKFVKNNPEKKKVSLALPALACGAPLCCTVLGPGATHRRVFCLELL